jgi:hypothetical protein
MIVNMKICVWSSQAFLAAAWITHYEPLYVLWVASTLNHLGYRWIYTFDKALAHTVCLWSMLTIPWELTFFVCLYWFSWFWVYFIYYGSGLSHKHDAWHASVHVVSSIGMVAHSWAHVHVIHRIWFPLLMGLVHMGLKTKDKYITC